MGAHHPNPRLAKIHRCYSVEEVSRLFRIHKNTVRHWQTRCRLSDNPTSRNERAPRRQREALENVPAQQRRVTGNSTSMSNVAPRPRQRNNSDSDVRHYCRKCRSKLPTPTENPRRAFCTRFCFDQHYRSRCVVCEKSFRRRSPTQAICGHHKCRLDLRKYPQTYRWSKNAVLVSETPISSASKPAVPATGPAVPATGDSVQFGIHGHRPLHHCLRNWWWSDEPTTDRSLYDRDGLTVARIVRLSDGWELRSPLAWRRQRWAELEAAQRGAEAIALQSLPDPFAAKHRRENEKPHPMGPPVNVPALFGGDHRLLTASSKIAESKLAGDPGPIPDFLLRPRTLVSPLSS